MRKFLIWGSMLLLILITAYSIWQREDGGLSYQTVTEHKAEKIASRMQEQETLEGFSLCFAGEKLPYDDGSKTFFLPLSASDSLWESGEIRAENGETVLFLEDFGKEDKQTLMAENHAIPFLAAKGNVYAAYSLKLTGLPVVTFTSTEEMTEAGEMLYAFSLYDSNTKTDWVTTCYTTSRLRGNTSLAYEKKSLRLMLKKKKKDGSFEKKNCNLLGIRNDDDWILNSLYADNTRLRDKLCMDLWQETGAYDNPYGKNFGMQGEYVEVLINDSYTGMYLLTHPIDRKQLGLSANAGNDTLPERLYKKKYAAAWQESDFTGGLPDLNQIDYRGGFYLKGNQVVGTEEEWEPLRRLAACIEADDETFTQQIGQLVNMSNLVDNWLFFQAIGGFDNSNKNVYYAARNEDGNYRGYFIPWDLNISFGAVYADNKYYAEETLEETGTQVQFEPGCRAIVLDADGARALAKEKWEDWKEKAFTTEALLERVQHLQQELTGSGAMAREMERWPGGNASTDLSLLTEFTKQRMAYMDSMIDGL